MLIYAQLSITDKNYKIINYNWNIIKLHWYKDLSNYIKRC